MVRFMFGLFLLSFHLQAEEVRCITGDMTLPGLAQSQIDYCNEHHESDSARKECKRNYKKWNNSIGSNNSSRCCKDLSPNIDTWKCEGDDSPVDSTVTFCQNHNDCAATDPTKGCYPFDTDDMFDDESQEAQQEEFEKKIEDTRVAQENAAEALAGNAVTWPILQFLFNAQGEDYSFGENNDKCSKNIECDSYFCHGGYCASKRTCKFAPLGYKAPDPIKCEEPLIKSQGKNVETNAQDSNICLDPYGIPAELGPLYNLITPTTNNKCDIGGVSTLETQQNLRVAISSLRAFEWLYVTQDSPNECLRHQEMFRSNVRDQVMSKRKEAMAVFSDGWNKVMEDFKTLAESSEDYKIKEGSAGVENVLFNTIQIESSGGNGTTNVQGSFNAQGQFQTTNQVVAGYTASGALVYTLMGNRATVLKNYEDKMNESMKEFAVRLDKLFSHYAALDTDSREWTFGINDFKNEEKKYGKKEVFCRYTKRLKVKRRWRRKYRYPSSGVNRVAVMGHSILADESGNFLNPYVFLQNSMLGTGTSVNADIQNSDVLKYAELVDPAEGNFVNMMVNKNLYLLDPMMPGNYNRFESSEAQKQHDFETYGSDGTFTGSDTNRKLSGSYNPLLGQNPTNWEPSILKMKKFMLASWFQYLKKSLPTNVPKTHLFPEPELGISAACNDIFITKINEILQNGASFNTGSTKCNQELERVIRLADIGWSQFIMHSMHRKSKYKDGYFSGEADSLKGKMALIQFMKEVTLKLEDYYKAMSEAHKKQIECLNQLVTKSEEMLEEGNGLVVGSSTYGITTENQGQNGNGQNQGGSGSGPRNNIKLTVNPFVSKAFSAKFGSGSQNSNMANSSKFNSASMASLNAEVAAIRKRMDDKRKALAAKNPTKAAEMAKKNEAILKSLGNNLVAGIGGSGSGSGSGSGNGANGSAGGIGASGNKVASLAGSANKNKSSSDGSGDGVGSGMNAYKSFNSPIGTGQSAFGDAGLTGLGKEEERNMLNEVDKKKSELKPNEDDSLFQVVSKSYQRNLGRVLKKKSENPQEIKKPTEEKNDKEDLKKAIKGL
jgi:hypothetical protein